MGAGPRAGRRAGAAAQAHKQIGNGSSLLVEKFVECEERDGASLDETVSVGDSVWAVQAASEAGIGTVGVLSGGAYGGEDLEDAGTVAVHDTCAALLQTDFPE